MSLRKRLLLLVSHPVVQGVVGLGMLAAGAMELLEPLLGAGEVAIGSAHGVMLYGALHAVRALLEVAEGFEKVEESVEQGMDEAA